VAWKVDEHQKETVRTVAEEIRAYLETNPNAADTLEGIVRWWHARSRYEEARRTVRAALDYLVGQGEVNSRDTAQGVTIYYRAGKGMEE
jgi:hypothetical protein